MAMEGSRRLKEALFGRAPGSTTIATSAVDGTSGITSSSTSSVKPSISLARGARVRYGCGGCGAWSGLAGATTTGGGAAGVSDEGAGYWCGDCGAVRCGARCVTAEVEAQYCGQCLDNVTSYDAALFRHRCKKCFRCPACLAPLSFAQQLARVADQPTTTASAATPTTGATAPQRVVYLHCSFCRWNSLALPSPLHADSPTALVTSFIKRERGDESQKRVAEQVEAFHREHREARLRARASKRSTHHLHHQPAPPPPSFEGGQKAPLGPITVEQVEQARLAQDAKLSLAAVKRESPLQLAPDDTLPSYPLQVSQTATLDQRLLDPNPDCRLVSELSAQRWLLGTRVSKRCRPCGKLLIKPDLIGAKTDFKRQHAALFYLPLISLEEVLQDEASGWWAFRVVLANPPQRSSHLPLIITASVEGAGEVQPAQPVETFLGVADEYDKFWETDVYGELSERDRKQNEGVVLHRHLNKLALRYRVGPLASSHVKLQFKITMGRAPATSEEATIAALIELELPHDQPSPPSSSSPSASSQ